MHVAQKLSFVLGIQSVGKNPEARKLSILVDQGIELRESKDSSRK